MIGGTTELKLQVKHDQGKNAIGETISKRETATVLTGWIDLASGDSKHSTYNTKMQESTHIFLSDYVALPDEVTAENTTALIDGKVFDVMIIDDPMGMHQHLEIYLKYTGGQ